MAAKSVAAKSAGRAKPLVFVEDMARSLVDVFRQLFLSIDCEGITAVPCERKRIGLEPSRLRRTIAPAPRLSKALGL
jgi:hypothetical protein